MSDLDFFHSVEIDEKSRQLKIYRIFPDGRKQFYTQMEMPSDGGNSTYETFSRMLGENLLLDSPAARRVMLL